MYKKEQKIGKSRIRISLPSNFYVSEFQRVLKNWAGCVGQLYSNSKVSFQKILLVYLSIPEKLSFVTLTLKTLEEVILILLETSWSPGFLKPLIYHMPHLSSKFHWSSSICSKDMKIFSVNINYVHQFFGFFYISLL